MGERVTMPRLSSFVLGIGSVGIGAQLRTVRRLEGWTQGEIADALQVSVPTVSSWERGLTSPTLAQFMQWCDLLDYDAVVTPAGGFTGTGRE